MDKKTLDTISTVMTAIGLIVGLIGKLADGKKQTIEIQEVCEKAAEKAVAKKMIEAQVQEVVEKPL